MSSSFRLLVLQQHADETLFALNDFVGLRRIVEFERVRDEWREIQWQLEESFHVALLGPADVADGVIDAVFFVERVVPARAVAAAETEIEFFAEENVARDFHAGHTDHDNAAPVATELTGEFDRLVAIGRGGND